MYHLPLKNETDNNKNPFENIWGLKVYKNVFPWVLSPIPKNESAKIMDILEIHHKTKIWEWYWKITNNEAGGFLRASD